MTDIAATLTRRSLLGLAAGAGVTLAARAGLGSVDAREAGSIRGPAWTTSNLNLRAGPSIEHDVLVVMPARSRVAIRGAARHGFYPVAYTNGAGKRYTGFAHGDSLARWGITTDDLNLRAGPGAKHEVRAVMPEGSRVVVVGLPRNAFYPVTYPIGEDGVLQGWASKTFLRWGAGAPPEF
jgi:uncharacterized protein YraI